MAMEKYGAKRLVCPKCGQAVDFQVVCKGSMTAYMDGQGDIYEVDNTHPEIDSKSTCICPECNYADDITVFEKPVGENDG